MNSVCFPDYDHSILGIPNSVLNHYGVQTEYATLPLIDEALQTNPKNVVVWILDGFGWDLFQKILPPKAFLKYHIKDKISSVFPPTTTAATTTYYSGLPPAVHGWIGWSPYFPEYNKSIELFTGKDNYTSENTGVNTFQKLPYTHIFDKIRAAAPSVSCHEVFPKKIRTDGVDTFEEQCQKILKYTQCTGQQFILAYWPDPDHTCHYEGTYDKSVQKLVRHMNHEIHKLYRKLKDTLVIISADHGHVPVESVFYIDTCPEITECLRIPLNLDDRVSAIFLKEGKESAFLKAFDTYLKSDFTLIKRDEVFSQNLFGIGPLNPRIKDFIGDYLLVATGTRILRQRVGNTVSGPEFKSAHAGLTRREMIVPLILFKK
ncbi:MAG: alkaline phosphatase family protein [Alphaproteobacteria bacterium]|nr:alkaline phosphatase family protein [Alphaproteobacteria bacterium]